MSKFRPKPQRPEAACQKNIIQFLTVRGWHVEVSHGNAFQRGWPDLLAGHRKWGPRFIDVKVAGQYSFTKAQKKKWPVWAENGLGVWIMTSPEDYDVLFGPPNWRDYWKDSWGDLPDIDKLLDEVE